MSRNYWENLDQRASMSRQDAFSMFEEDDSLSFYEGAIDVARGAGNGFVGVGQSILGLVDSGFEMFGGDLVADRYTDNPAFGETETILGGLTEGVTQFATAFIPVAGVLSKVGWLSKLKNANKMGAAAFDLTSGAVADFLAFNAHEERLSNLIQQYPLLENPVTELLAADDDDNEAVGRFKNSLEGLGLGGIAGVLGRTVRATGILQKAKESLLPQNVMVNPATGKIETEDVIAETEVRLRDMLEGLPDEEVNISDMSNYPLAIRKKVKPLGDEDFESLAEQVRNVAIGKANITDIGRDLYPNLNRLIQERGTLEAHKFISNAVKDRLNVARSGNTTGKQTLKGIENEAVMESVLKDVSDMTNTKLSTLRKRVKAGGGWGKDMAVDYTAARMILAAQSQHIHALTKSPRSPEVLADLTNSIRDWIDLKQDVVSIRTGAARTTTAGRIKIEDAVDQESVNRAIEEMGGAKRFRVLLHKLAMANGDPRMINQTIESSFDRGFRKLIDVHNEVFISSILFGPITSTVNVMSNTAHMFMLPLEKALGGTSDLIWGDTATGLAEVQDAGIMAVGLVGSVFDALRGSGRAFVAGDNILAPTSTVIDAPIGAIGNRKSTSDLVQLGKRTGQTVRNVASGKGFDLDDEANIYQTALDWLGNGVRIPGRALAAQDEFFKMILYGAHVRMKALREMKAQNIPQAQRKQFLQDKLSEAFDATTREGLDKESLQFANRGTFTEDLEKGFARWLQQGTNQMPAMRIVLPFVRTPTNLLRNVAERTPGLNLAMKRYRREFFSSDPAVRSAARGKFATGTLLATSAAVLAYNGKMNGGGPTDPEQRSKWINAGNEPYSFKFENKDGTITSISFGRLDPWASFFAVAADAAEIAKASDAPGADNDVATIIGGLAAAVSEQTVNKSYLTGLRNILEALSDPERFAGSFLQRHIASVAVPNLLNQTNPDDIIRETRNLTDQLRRRIPGYSEGVPPKRNMLGEPIKYADRWLGGRHLVADILSPFNIREYDPNSVDAEIAELGKGFQHPRKEAAGIDLTTVENESGQSAYDRWLELHGQVRLNGKTLRETLQEVFNSEFYQQLPKQSELGDLTDSNRVSIVRSIRSRFREVARRQMLQEFPELREAIYQREIALSRAEVLGLSTE